MGAGVRWDRERCAELVCVTEPVRGIYSTLLFERECTVMASDMHQVFVFRAAGEFGRVGIQLGGRVFGRRISGGGFGGGGGGAF